MTPDPQRWRQLAALFEQALAQPADAREAFITDACGDDDALASDLRRLLVRDAEAEAEAEAEAGNDGHEHVLGQAIGQTATQLLSDRHATVIGQRFGPWRVVAHIADGGMGAVYRAERDDGQYTQPAALKLLSPALLSRDAAQRLAHERQILARLSHPHIARLLDGGTTDAGAPYLVMEYVDGQPIDAWCRQQQLGTAARLRLFVQVCRAVDYAHRNFVVHRDLKPANILVDREGVPRLLDFGIARLLEDADPGLTRSGERMLTPSRASPEQITGGTITTATDVYALGVLLFDLLTGRLPHADTTGNPIDLARAIVETEPPRPSTVVTASDAGGGTARRGEALSPQRLARELAGDLDNIVLVALRKEPERRYAGAGALAEDIERHLAGLPVRARPNTLGYRTSKFLRRHAWGSAATVVALAGFVAVVGFYTLRLQQERDRATVAAEKSAEVAKFLVNVFRNASPQRSERAATARELLDATVAGVDKMASSQPVLYSDLLMSTAMVYRELGDFAAAEPQLRKLLQVNQGIFQQPHPLSIQAKHQLATLLQQQGKLAEAEPLFVDGLAEARGLNPPDPIALAFTLNNLAKLRVDQGRYAEAEAPLAEAAALYGAQKVPLAQAWRGVALRNQARAVRLAGDWSRADALMAQSIAALTEGYSQSNPRHPNVGESYLELATLRLSQGRLDEARTAAETALGMLQHNYADGHAMVGRTQILLAAIEREAGHLPQAQRALQDGEAQLTAHLKAPHPWLAEAVVERAMLAAASQGPKQALGQVQQALDAVTQAHAQGHPEALHARIALDRLRAEAGECKTAAADLKAVVQGLSQRLGQAHPWVGQARLAAAACQ